MVLAIPHPFAVARIGAAARPAGGPAASPTPCAAEIGQTLGLQVSALALRYTNPSPRATNPETNPSSVVQTPGRPHASAPVGAPRPASEADLSALFADALRYW